MNRAPVNQAVQNLQRMLRTISMDYPEIPILLPDGVFGEQTLEAVMRFQRIFHPPVTGRVDFDTWNAIVTLFRQVEAHYAPPRTQPDYPTFSNDILPGERSVHLYLMQSILKALSRGLAEVEDGPINGVHDGHSVRNIRWVQRVSGQEQTGKIDRMVWDTLARLYTIFVNYAETPWYSRTEVLRS